MDNKPEAFSQVAITLINHYRCVYYVDIKSGTYTNLVPLELFENLGVPFQGEDFFADFKKYIDKCVYPSDLHLFEKLLDKDQMLERLSETGTYTMNFRSLNNGRSVHIRHSEFMCLDKEHVICCLEDVEKEFQKDELQRRNLESAERMARFDELTGVRNNNAYREYAESIDQKIKNKTDFSFGVIICDMNDLKQINDTRGHNFGDEAIQRTSRLICETFTHSPVFRIGGDEFVVILQGQDYENRDALLEELKEESYSNKLSRSGPVIACGLAVYNSKTDKELSDVMKRADKEMYNNKKEVKSLNLTQSFRDMDKINTPITKEKKRQLDAMFGALCTVAGGGYVYLNDMRYDYSRWALALVDDFGMESEYMYHADQLWQERIHPEDLKAYRNAVDAVLCDNVDMVVPLTYRARRADGTYAVLTTRGFILSDKNGKPEYFGGIIIPM